MDSDTLFYLGLYFAPTIIAGARGHLSLLSIALVNALLGWTGIGWVVAMIWAASGNTAGRQARIVADGIVRARRVKGN